MKRYIGHNAASEIPSNLLFVDTEAWIQPLTPDTDVLKLRLWASNHVRLEKGKIKSTMWQSGNTAAEFWKYLDTLTQSKKPLHVFAHNAKYDMKQLELYGQFDSGRLVYVKRKPKLHPNKQRNTSTLAIDGRPYFIKCKHSDNSTIWVVDTMNYFNCSLAELGQSIGLLKIECDLTCIDDFTLMRYCWRDVEIISKAMIELITGWQSEDCGNWRTSAAGLSMQNFKHLVMDHRTPQVKGIKRYSIAYDLDRKFDEMEREAYMGGRIEAFHIGTVKGDLYSLDVKSMYPSVMRDGYFPTDHRDTLYNPPINEIRDMMPARGVLASVIIDSNTERFPLRLGGRQVHASGRFPTVLCGDELRRALDTKSVERINTALIYAVAPLFREWCELWLDKRDRYTAAGNSARAGLCKIILNSLHGKFAQRGYKWKDCDIPIPLWGGRQAFKWGTWIQANLDQHSIIQCRAFNGNVQCQSPGKPPEETFPAISAFISAAAREKLRSLIEQCPEQSVYYTAVDSLICDKSALSKLIHNGEVSQGTVGKLQIQGKHEEIEVVSQCCYRLDSQWVESGLFSKALIEDANVRRALQFDNEPIKHGDLVADVLVNKSIVYRAKTRPKGMLLADGWVKPYNLDTSKIETKLTIEEVREWLCKLPLEDVSNAELSV